MNKVEKEVMEAGRILKMLRDRIGRPLIWICSMLQVRPETWWRWERGISAPHPHHWARLERLISEFVGEQAAERALKTWKMRAREAAIRKKEAKRRKKAMIAREE